MLAQYICMLLLTILSVSGEDVECGIEYGSTAWDDQVYSEYWGDITKVEVWHGNVIDGIRFTYGSEPGPVHGSSGGGEHYTYVLGAGERIIGARMSYGDEGFGFEEVVCKLKFYIMRPDFSIFSLKIFGQCPRNEEECREYINENARLLYSSGTHNEYINTMTLTFEVLTPQI